MGVLVACAVTAGGWLYSHKCHGIDACAAQSAESHERDAPKEPQ